MDAVITTRLGEAVAHDRAGRHQRAEDLLTGLLALAPAHADILHTLGDLKLRKGELAAALDLVRQAIAHRPDVARHHRTQAEILRQLGRTDDALAAADRAVAADPRDETALMVRSAIQLDRLALPEAVADARQALALRPSYAEAHMRRGELALLQGDLAAGWPDLAWKSRIFGAAAVMPTALNKRRWAGEHLPDGALLLVADQGYGDVIQFARYIPWAAKAAGRLAFACDPALRRLLAPIDPGMLVFEDWAQAPAFTAWSALSDLPMLHGTRLDAIPPQRPLAPDPQQVADWERHLAGLCPPGLRRVGLAWAGRTTHPNDRNRSLPLAALAPVTARDGVVFVSLQLGPARDDIARERGRAKLIDAGARLQDFADTAALIATLDLVITVDTALAHLAGAMGKPVWIMLPYAPDWRWLLGRADSPWYPSARLFRQPAPRRWDLVAADIAQALSA